MSHINRNYVAQTGDIGRHTLLQDSIPFEIKRSEPILMESVGPRRGPSPSGLSGGLRLGGRFQYANRPNANGRIYDRDVLGEAIEDVQEDIKNRRILGEYDHPCRRTSDFRVYTTDCGWKEFKDLKVGDYVWSRVNGKLTPSRINEIIDRPYEGDIYNIKGKNIDDSFTPDHRILHLKRRDYKPSEEERYATIKEIYDNRKKYYHNPIPLTAEWEGEYPEFIRIPGIPESELNNPKNYKNNVTEDLLLEPKKFAAFLGIYLAEGNITTSGISISQKNDFGRKIIKEMLDQLHPELEWKETKNNIYVADRRLHEYLKPLGNKYTKYIPHFVKQFSSELLEELIYWFVIGDGRILKGSRDESFISQKPVIAEDGHKSKLDQGTYSRMSVFSTSKQLIDDLHDCLIKTGRCGYRSTVETTKDCPIEDRNINQESKKPLYQLSISRKKHIYLSKYLNIEKDHHSGRIYCLSVDHGNFYMESKGHSYWTGNCDAKVHLDRVSHVVTKLWMEDDEVFGEIEVLPKTQCGGQLMALHESNVSIGISSRGVGDMEIIEHDGEQYNRVLPGYAIVTFDVVAEPSVAGSYLTVQESVNRDRRSTKSYFSFRESKEKQVREAIKEILWK